MKRNIIIAVIIVAVLLIIGGAIKKNNAGNQISVSKEKDPQKDAASVDAALKFLDGDLKTSSSQKIDPKGLSDVK